MNLAHQERAFRDEQGSRVNAVNQRVLHLELTLLSSGQIKKALRPRADLLADGDG
ncbi:hypothetical protein D3C85_1863500 [compost metagenome]